MELPAIGTTLSPSLGLRRLSLVVLEVELHFHEAWSDCLGDVGWIARPSDRRQAQAKQADPEQHDESAHSILLVLGGADGKTPVQPTASNSLAKSRVRSAASGRCAGRSPPDDACPAIHREWRRGWLRDLPAS